MEKKNKYYLSIPRFHKKAKKTVLFGVIGHFVLFLWVKSLFSACQPAANKNGMTSKHSKFVNSLKKKNDEFHILMVLKQQKFYINWLMYRIVDIFNGLTEHKNLYIATQTTTEPTNPSVLNIFTNKKNNEHAQQNRWKMIV